MEFSVQVALALGAQVILALQVLSYSVCRAVSLKFAFRFTSTAHCKSLNAGDSLLVLIARHTLSVLNELDVERLRHHSVNVRSSVWKEVTVQVLLRK